jgi:hypothetical protein
MLHFNIKKIVTVKKGPLDSYFTIPCKGLFIDMPEDSLNIGRNM